MICSWWQKCYTEAKDLSKSNSNKTSKTCTQITT